MRLGPEFPRAQPTKDGFSFEIDNARPRGPKVVVMAAKDPVRVPEDPRYTVLMERCLCICTLVDGVYRLTCADGNTADIPYGAGFEVWVSTCEKLLAEAME